MMFFSSLLLFGAISMSMNSCSDIDELDKFEGMVTDTGTMRDKSGQLNLTVFYVRLDGLDQILASYNQGQSYYDLQSQIKVGDKIKVYYQHSFNSTRPNLATYQIEKEGQVVLRQADVKSREMTGAIICIVGLGLLLTIGYYQDKKYRPKTRVEE
jgi:hypothetical protein